MNARRAVAGGLGAAAMVVSAAVGLAAAEPASAESFDCVEHLMKQGIEDEDLLVEVRNLCSIAASGYISACVEELKGAIDEHNERDLGTTLDRQDAIDGCRLGPKGLRGG